MNTAEFQRWSLAVGEALVAVGFSSDDAEREIEADTEYLLEMLTAGTSVSRSCQATQNHARSSGQVLGRKT